MSLAGGEPAVRTTGRRRGRGAREPSLPWTRDSIVVAHALGPGPAIYAGSEKQRSSPRSAVDSKRTTTSRLVALAAPGRSPGRAFRTWLLLQARRSVKAVLGRGARVRRGGIPRRGPKGRGHGDGLDMSPCS